MKVQFTGYSSFTSYKKNPSGDTYLIIGIVYKNPNWQGLCAESKMIPTSFLADVQSWKVNSIIDIEEFNRKIQDITLVSEPK